MSPTVDIHCHIFNGDDLPLRGFIERVGLRNSGLGNWLVALLDAAVRVDAPGYWAESKRLDAYLGAGSGISGLESLIAEQADPARNLDADVLATYEALILEQPRLLAEVEQALEAEYQTPADDGQRGEGLESIFGAPAALLRGLRYVKLYGGYRHELAAIMVENFHDEVDLFTPLMVDLEFGLHDRADSSLGEQMEMMEKISRLSMLGLLPGGGKAHIHPFFAFDPRREVHARRIHAIETPLDLLERAVTRFGFIGVKLYPPMGFRPTGNTENPEMPGGMAVEVDEALTDLYGLCRRLDIPITTHSNDSNHAHERYRGYGSPADWGNVLMAHGDLHLNLGHVGGADEVVPADPWPNQIGRLAQAADHVYADVGCHRIYDERLRTLFLGRLEAVYTESPKLEQHLMYGSDWFMNALHPRHDLYLETYRDAYRTRFPTAAESFMGDAAIRFLFSDGDGLPTQNAERVRQRYQDLSSPTPDWLP